MKIKVIHCQKVFPIYITSDTTIKGLLELIKEELNIKAPINHFILVLLYNYRKLDKEDMTIEQYNIRDNSYIELRNVIDERQIKLKFRNEEIEMIFPCFCCYSILDYKKEIEKRRGYPIESQFLYNDKNSSIPLKDDDYLSIPTFLSLDDEEIKKGYNIKYFDGIEKFDIISGNKLEKIKDIKKEIETSYKLPKGSYELVFDDIVLSEEKILTDYNIYNVSIIYLIIEQKYEKLLLSNILKSNYLTFSKIKKNNYFKINKVYYLEIKMNNNANKTRILYNIIIFLVNKLTNLKFY